MLGAYPSDISFPNVIDTARLEIEKRRYGISEWHLLGSLYGTSWTVKAAVREFKNAFGKTVGKFTLLTQQKLNFLCRLSRLPGVPLTTSEKLKKLQVMLDILNGIPREAALPLAYWRKPGGMSRARTPLNPTRDRCGIIWYAPLVPLVPRIMTDFENMVKAVCHRNGIEPLITFSTFNHALCDATVPILFDSEDSSFRDAAWKCHDELLSLGKELGCYPYRWNIDSMQDLSASRNGYNQMVAKIKSVLDPHSIIAPGRYGIGNRHAEGKVPLIFRK
jgi:hypothetical protein